MMALSPVRTLRARLERDELEDVGVPELVAPNAAAVVADLVEHF